MARMPGRWLRSLDRGAGYLTLNPAPRLSRLREAQERRPLPPLPDSAYTPEGALMEPRTWPPED